MKILNNIGTWIKSHIVISVVGVCIIGGGIATPIVMHNVNENNKFKIELNDNLDFEVNSEVFLLSLVKKVSNGELVTENKKIDTSKLGEQEIKIEYLDNKKKKKEYSFKIKIVDTTKPSIEYQKEVSTIVGTEIDLLNDVKVTDNSNEEIKATIEGEYDINKSGSYNLKYVAIDSSNNKVEEEFVLNVKNATIKTNGSYYSNSGKIMNIDFENDKKISIAYDTGCTEEMPCGGYSEMGTYKIDGNKIIATMTHYYGIVEEKLDKVNKLEFIIVNENQIKNNNQVFNYRK